MQGEINNTETWSANMTEARLLCPDESARVRDQSYQTVPIETRAPTILLTKTA